MSVAQALELQSGNRPNLMTDIFCDHPISSCARVSSHPRRDRARVRTRLPSEAYRAALAVLSQSQKEAMTTSSLSMGALRKLALTFHVSLQLLQLAYWTRALDRATNQSRQYYVHEPGCVTFSLPHPVAPRSCRQRSTVRTYILYCRCSPFRPLPDTDPEFPPSSLPLVSEMHLAW